MRTLFALLLVLAAPFARGTANSVTVPWSEFKSLYTEQVRQDLAAGSPETPEPVYAIDAAHYRLVLRDEALEGAVTLAGRVLEGRPPPVTLFGDDVAVTAVDAAEGASLIGGEGGYRLYLSGAEGFSVSVRIAVPLRDERATRLAAFRIPEAVSNSLALEVPEDWRILDAPGMRHSDGRYVFPPGSVLNLRLAQVDGAREAAPPLVDTFSRISRKGARFLFTTWFAPAPSHATDFRIQLPDGARLVNSTLGARLLRDAGEGVLAVTLPATWEGTFAVRYELPAGDGETVARLPTIDGNLGREGEFDIDQPEDGRITLEGEGYRRALPYRQLPALLRPLVADTGSYARAPSGGEVRFAHTRFDAVSAPEVVLDTAHLYTSFTDNGRALSVLRLELAPGAGDKLDLGAVPDSEIWSLRVNGKSRRLYSQSGARWVVPLEPGVASVVELAYLSRGERLGLSGRLPLRIPATGIAARRLHVAVGLAERVELVALEGDLVPAGDAQWPRVQEFTGTPYHFVHPYYRGRALEAAVYYKEPVEGQRRAGK